MRKPIALAMLTAMVVAVVLGTGPAAAWASWPGAAPLLASGGRLAWPGPAADAALAWQVDLPGPVIAGPVVGLDGTVYAATGTGLVALDPTGDELWTAVCPSILPGSLALVGGASQALVVATTSPRAVKAFASASGAALFSSTLITPPIGPVLAAADDTFHVVTSDGYLRTFDLAGNQLWRYCLGRGSSQPMFIRQGGEICVLLNTGTLVAVDPIRHLSAWRCLTDMLPGSGPLPGSEEEIYFVAAAGDVVRVGVDHCLDWHRPTGARGSPAILANGQGVVTACGDGTVQLLTPDGTEAWRTVNIGATGMLGVMIDSLGIIHTVAGASIARIDSTGAQLDALPLEGGMITAWAFPAAGVMLTASGSSIRQYASPASGDMEDEDGGLDGWAPEITLAAPPDTNGWYTEMPVICLGESCCRTWPLGASLSWSASNGTGSAAGVLSPTAASAPIPLEGAVNVQFALSGSGGAVQCEAIPALELMVDGTPPTVELEWPTGQHVYLQPGPWDPAVSITDRVSGLGEVEVLLDGEVSLPPYQLAGGVHTLAIRAKDVAGNAAERIVHIVAGTVCPAVSLSPVIIGGPSSASQVWSRWITVLFRLPAAELLPGSASPQLAGVGGAVVARLPVNVNAGYRAYLARFERTALIEAIAARCDNTAAFTRLIPVTLDLVVMDGEKVYCSAVTILWRP